MRFALGTIVGLASLLPTVLGIPVIYIRNFCPYNVYWWHVGQGGVGGQGELGSGGNDPDGYTHDVPDDQPGQAYKISREVDGLYTGAPLTIFAYNSELTDTVQRFWVDLSNVFGAPFDGEKVTVTGALGCDPIIWETGTPSGSNIRACAYDGQIEMHLCAQNGG